MLRLVERAGEVLWGHVRGPVGDRRGGVESRRPTHTCATSRRRRGTRWRHYEAGVAGSAAGPGAGLGGLQHRAGAWAPRDEALEGLSQREAEAAVRLRLIEMARANGLRLIGFPTVVAWSEERIARGGNR